MSHIQCTANGRIDQQRNCTFTISIKVFSQRRIVQTLTLTFKFAQQMDASIQPCGRETVRQTQAGCFEESSIFISAILMVEAMSRIGA